MLPFLKSWNCLGGSTGRVQFYLRGLSLTPCAKTAVFASIRWKMTQQSSDTVADMSTRDHPQLSIHLRDISEGMVEAWKEAFKDNKYSKYIKARKLR